ncbi:MAG: hypothetical protein FWG43_05860, partial [Clostridiales bacterium]|nr:hypothetical protein [Clostridiales bacterium]
CQSCARTMPGIAFATYLSPGAIMSMNHILQRPLSRLPQLKVSPSFLQEIAQAINPYIDYYLEHASKAREMLRSLL